MVRMIINAAVLASMAAAEFAAVPAAAQEYYGRGGFYHTYDGSRYYDDGDRREEWLARQRYWQHERWEQRRRWEQEQARRDYWQRERFEHRGWGDYDDY